MCCELRSEIVDYQKVAAEYIFLGVAVGTAELLFFKLVEEVLCRGLDNSVACLNDLACNGKGKMSFSEPCMTVEQET